MGPANAKITIVEFSDFECPFCAKFSKNVISAIRRQYPNDVAFVFRHMPLPMHRFADPAARAAECAAVQGRFEEFHNSLFSKQDSLGLKSFGAFAQESGVGDLKAFEACTRRTDKNTVVQGDVAEATRSSVRATPTVIANGWWIHPAADSVRLDSLIRAELRRGNWKMTGSP
jgi:protein-disulfide isomerase